MSYDLVFLRRDPGQGWPEALEALGEREGEAPLSVREREQWDAVVRRARELLGELTVTADDVSAQLTEEASGIQVELSAGEASVSVSYGSSGGHDDDTVVLMEKVYALARVVEEETGLEGFDPQLDEPVSELGLGRARGRSSTAGSARSWDSGSVTVPSDAAAVPPGSGRDADRPYADSARSDDTGDGREQRARRRPWWRFWRR